VGTSGLLVGPALGGTLAPWGARVLVAAALALAVVVTLVAALAPHPDVAPPAAPRALRTELLALAGLARNLAFHDTYGGLFGLLATLTDLMTIVGPLLFLNLYRAGGRLTFVAMAIIGVGFGALSAVHLRRPAARGV